MLRLRKATEADCGLLFVWANDAETRRYSVHSEPIAWKTHCAWLAAKLRDPACHLFIAQNPDDVPIGQICFDVEDTRAVISISLDAPQRGHGYSVPLITQGVEMLRSEVSVQHIDAWIKPENIASQRAFERAGFLYTCMECVNGLSLCRFILSLR